MRIEEGRSLGADRGRKVTCCRYSREGHLVRIEGGRSLGADRGGKVTWCG